MEGRKRGTEREKKIVGRGFEGRRGGGERGRGSGEIAGVRGACTNELCND